MWRLFKRVVKWFRGEDIYEILESPEHSYRYAFTVLRAPFPLGEPAIAKSSMWSYFYARYVLKSPFPLGEASIAQDAECSYRYALNVLQDPAPHTWAKRYLSSRNYCPKSNGDWNPFENL